MVLWYKCEPQGGRLYNGIMLYWLGQHMSNKNEGRVIGAKNVKQQVKHDRNSPGIQYSLEFSFECGQ